MKLDPSPAISLDFERQILSSWQQNASPWHIAIQANQIESRQLVTNQAILDAILANSPRTVLDLGCGEGWLVRALIAEGIEAIGVDAVADLIAQARQTGAGDFQVVSYDDLIHHTPDILNLGHVQTWNLQQGKTSSFQTERGLVDLIVCNFSLFGHQSVASLLSSLPNYLRPQGKLIIQTLHPLVAGGDLPYQDGWREGSWAGFSSDFTNPPPWYFRTLSSWVTLLTESGFQIQAIQEPIHPVSQQPASVIFIAQM
jgi:SAM-dependent methyltransferase